MVRTVVDRKNTNQKQLLQKVNSQSVNSLGISFKMKSHETDFEKHTSRIGGKYLYGIILFSDLNQLNDISMKPQYATICGITRQELEDTFIPELNQLAEMNELTYEETVNKMTALYDGYHFCEFAEGVFNPFSVLNVFDGYKFSNYWFQTVTPTFLVELLKESEYDLRTLIDGIEASASSFMEYRVDANNPIPLIYQSGYLTIKDYDKEFQLYRLAFPNDEVRYKSGLYFQGSFKCFFEYLHRNI